jgi:hypothetical protein
VAGYFTFTLVSGLAAGSLLAGDVIRHHIPFEQWVSFGAQHPLTYVFGCAVAVLLGLLAIGDV